MFCVCVKTIFANYHEFSRKIYKLRKKDEITWIFVCACEDDFRELSRNLAKKSILRECLCVGVKTIFANHNEISQKINKFREKAEITRMFCVC